MHLNKTILLFLIILIPSFTFTQTAAVLEFDLQEEGYVNDIPFNTSNVYAEYILDNCIASKQPQFMMPEESSVEDIPFDTRDIASSVIRCKKVCKMQLIKCFSIPLKNCGHELAQKRDVNKNRDHRSFEFRSGSIINPTAVLIANV